MNDFGLERDNRIAVEMAIEQIHALSIRDHRQLRAKEMPQIVNAPISIVVEKYCNTHHTYKNFRYLKVIHRNPSRGYNNYGLSCYDVAECMKLDFYKDIVVLVRRWDLVSGETREEKKNSNENKLEYFQGAFLTKLVSYNHLDENCPEGLHHIRKWRGKSPQHMYDKSLINESLEYLLDEKTNPPKMIKPSFQF